MHASEAKSEYVGEHVVVKSIDIIFKEGIEASKELDVFVANKAKSAQYTQVDQSERRHRWSFKHGLPIFPNDELVIRPLYSRLSRSHFTVLHRDEIDSYTIPTKDIISFCRTNAASSPSDEVDYSGAPSGKKSHVVLKVLLRGFSTALVEVDTTSLNPSAKSEILESLSSSESLQEGVEQLQSVLSTIGANVDIVQKLENVLENAASVHPIAKAAVSALLIPYKLMKAEHEFKKDMQSLADEMRFLLKLLEDERWIAKLSSTKDTVMEIMKEVIDTSVFINDFVNMGRFKQFGAAQTRSKLDEHVKCFEKLRKNFETALNLQNAGLISQTASTVSKMAQEDEEQRLQGFLKKKLDPAEQQPLGNPCLEGTRVKILTNVEDWLKDTRKRNILWINGAPGSGKSTVATTIVKKMLVYKCAMFFVKRNQTPELRDPRRVWRTVAFDLANLHHEVKEDIVEALQDREEYPKNAEVGDQFRDLLEAPIRKYAKSLPADRPYVVIIDALDECRTSDEDWSSLLGTLSDWSKLPSNVKLIVTSRNEKDIGDRLLAVSERIVLETGTRTSDETSDDIRLFFNSRFLGMGVSDKTWPGETTVMRLTKYAAGLFIWAKTVVEFVGHKKWHPPRRLKIICDDLGKGSADIDGLYGQILYETFSEMEDEELDAAKFLLATTSMGKGQLAIQDLVELYAPDDGSNEKEEFRSTIQMAVQALSPVINVRETDELLSVCHKTLADLLSNESRMQEVMKRASERAQRLGDEKNVNRYVIRRSEQNTRLAGACLQVMNKKLKFNICHLPTSHRFNDAIPILNELVAEHIPRYFLYACQHWAEHLDDMGDGTTQTQASILPALRNFLLTNILYWLEVLSLTSSVSCASPAMVSAENYTKTRDETLFELARDANQFASTFFQVISESVPHIYLSALPFASTESKVAQIYGPRYPNTLSIVSPSCGVKDEVVPVVEMFGQSDDIVCLAYLRNGELIASGSRDGTIRIWDAHNGRAIPGANYEHPCGVRYLASLDRVNGVASVCEEGTFRLWDTLTHQCTSSTKMGESIEGYSAVMALSRDGEECAFLCDDQVIEIRATKDGQLKCRFSSTDPENIVYSVVFSPNGLSVIWRSGPGNGVVTIGNTNNGDLDGTPIAVESTLNTCLAVSEDGVLVASGDEKGVAQLYRFADRIPLGAPMRGHRTPIHCLAFSADRKLLVSGSYGGTVCFWDIESQKCVGGPHHVQGHRIVDGSGGVCALSFSPEGSRLAVAVSTGTSSPSIQLWDVKTCLGLFPADEGWEVDRSNNDWRILCIVFDTPRQKFASGSFGGVVRIWDALSGSLQAEWPEHDESVDDQTAPGSCMIISLVFVWDSDLIAFSSQDGHVRKWNPKTKQLHRDVLISDLRDALPQHRVEAMSPDGKHIAFIHSTEDQEIYYVVLWNYDLEQEVKRFAVKDYCFQPRLAFSPDGAMLALARDSRIEIWQVELLGVDAGKQSACRAELEVRGEVYFIKFSSDGKELVFGNEDGSFGLWDSEAHPTYRALALGRDSHDNVLYNDCCVSSSPSLNVIAAASGDGTVQFLNMSTGEIIGKDLKKQNGLVIAIEFLNDGTLISVDDSESGAIKIWDLKTDGATPLFLQSLQALDSSKVAEVSIMNGTGDESSQRIVHQNLRTDNVSQDASSISYPAFFDGMGSPAIGDWSYLDYDSDDGWVRNRRVNGEKSDDDPIMFWLPSVNRHNFWWPRNISIAFMNANRQYPVTRIDFSRFMHGEDWQRCGGRDKLDQHKKDTT